MGQHEFDSAPAISFQLVRLLRCWYNFFFCFRVYYIYQFPDFMEFGVNLRYQPNRKRNYDHMFRSHHSRVHYKLLVRVYIDLRGRFFKLLHSYVLDLRQLHLASRIVQRD